MTTNDKQGALVPRFRFPEFREEPAWIASRLGDLAAIVKGKSVSKADIKSDGALPAIRYAELYTIYGEVIREVVSRTNLDAENLVLSEPDDVLIPASGETKADIATAACLPIARVALGSDLNVIRSSLHGPFFSYYLNGSKRADITRVAQGDTVAHLYPTQLQKVVVHYPKRAEQQKIADCLGSLDDLIAAERRKLAALRDHKQGLMQQLFPREGETCPRLRFPEFCKAGEWQEKLLSALITSLDAGVSVNSGDRPASKKEFGILKTSAVTSGVFEPIENKVVNDEIELKRLKEPVQADTIIISRMNTPALVGANAYVDGRHGNLFLPDRLWAAKPKPGTSMRFVAYVLGSGRGRSALSALGTGTSGSMKNIAKTSLFELKVLTPRLAEQERIASCLSALDARITAQAKQIDVLRTHKLGLMQQLFPALDNAAA